ncbi:hypothetical protein [Phreatobacter sp.]|uniref:hypothetical protein n=1 Tax=Phreatobacter sp. TaxID=1966341 RepID=UPI0025D3CF09|nr:hypothetical protein [Phreatobacter sp.]
MTPIRRHARALAGAAAGIPAVMPIARGQTPQVTRRLHHDLPPVSSAQQRFPLSSSRRVQEASGNRIGIDSFLSVQFDAAPPQLFDQARDGVADIVRSLPGSTAGGFPATGMLQS